jgi:hypothetical protein
MAIRTIDQANLYRFAAIRQIDQGNLYKFARFGDAPPSLPPVDFYLYVRGIWQRAQAKAIAQQTVSDLVTQSTARKLAGKVLDVFGFPGAADTITGFDPVSVFSNLAKLGADIDSWGTTKLQWAVAGKTPEGVPYDWRKWYATGAMFAEAASFHAQEALNSTYLNASIDAALKTMGDTKGLVKDAGDTFGKWLPWLAVGLGAVAVMYVTGTIKPFLPKPKRA